MVFYGIWTVISHVCVCFLTVYVLHLYLQLYCWIQWWKIWRSIAQTISFFKTFYSPTNLINMLILNGVPPTLLAKDIQWFWLRFSFIMKNPKIVTRLIIRQIYRHLWRLPFRCYQSTWFSAPCLRIDSLWTVKIVNTQILRV